MSLSEIFCDGVVGLDIVNVEEYTLVLLSLIVVLEVFGSWVSTGSFTQEGSVEPSTPGDGLYVTKTEILDTINVEFNSSTKCV